MGSGHHHLLSSKFPIICYSSPTCFKSNTRVFSFRSISFMTLEKSTLALATVRETLLLNDKTQSTAGASRTTLESPDRKHACAVGISVSLSDFLFIFGQLRIKFCLLVLIKCLCFHNISELTLLAIDYFFMRAFVFSTERNKLGRKDWLEYERNFVSLFKGNIMNLSIYPYFMCSTMSLVYSFYD